MKHKPTGFPEAEKALNKWAREGDYEITFPTPADAIAFRRRTYTFRAQYTRWVEAQGMQNLYAMVKLVIPATRPNTLIVTRHFDPFPETEDSNVEISDIKIDLDQLANELSSDLYRPEEAGRPDDEELF